MPENVNSNKTAPTDPILAAISKFTEEVKGMRLEAATKEDVRSIGARLDVVENRMNTSELRIAKLEKLQTGTDEYFP